MTARARLGRELSLSALRARAFGRAERASEVRRTHRLRSSAASESLDTAPDRMALAPAGAGGNGTESSYASHASVLREAAFQRFIWLPRIAKQQPGAVSLELPCEARQARAGSPALGTLKHRAGASGLGWQCDSVRLFRPFPSTPPLLTRVAHLGATRRHHGRDPRRGLISPRREVRGCACAADCLESVQALGLGAAHGRVSCQRRHCAVPDCRKVRAGECYTGRDGQKTEEAGDSRDDRKKGERRGRR